MTTYKDMENMERRKRQCTPALNRVPWLLFPCGKNRKDQNFCTISPSSSQTIVELKSIPELRKTSILASYHGWLLLTTDADDEDDFLILWHPTTYESIKLPPLPSWLSKDKIVSSIFTTSPKHSGCTVMLFDPYNATITYCQPGDQEWTKHDYQMELGEETPLYGLACLDGRIYATTLDTPMVSIEIDNQTAGVRLESLGHEQPCTRMFAGTEYSLLVESDGELYAIYLNLGGMDSNEVFGIEVFRWEFFHKVWVEVDNLDGRLIFVSSRWNCTSCLADGERGNQIFFMREKDKHLYMYDLVDGKILTSLPCPRLQSPWYKPFWVTPDPDPDAQVKLQEHKSKALEQHTKVEVESPRNMDASADPYPQNFCLDSFTAIARHLQPLDYLEFRATCRLFSSAAPATKWSITSIMNSLESPWLVSFRHDKSVFTFTDPKHNHTYRMNVPQSLLGTLISGSKDGYLLMANGMTLFYFNPFTGIHVKLPTPCTYDTRVSFSSSPSSSDCLMVWIDEYLSEVAFIRQGETHWKREAIEGDLQVFKKNGPGVYHKGIFYCLGQQGNLGILTVVSTAENEEEVSWEVLEKPEAPGLVAVYHNYLAECDGELMAIFVGRNGNWVKVFRLDTCGKDWNWVRVRSLGNKALFISNISSIAVVATSPGMENKVYFPRFHEEHIVYYSLETEKFHTHGSNVALDNFVGTKEQLYCTWIEPRD